MVYVSIEEDLRRMEAKMLLLFKISKMKFMRYIFGKWSLGNVTQDILNKVEQKESSRNIPSEFIQMEYRTWTRMD